MAWKLDGYLTKDLFDCFSLISSTAGHLLYKLGAWLQIKTMLRKDAVEHILPHGLLGGLFCVEQSGSPGQPCSFAHSFVH